MRPHHPDAHVVLVHHIVQVALVPLRPFHDPPRPGALDQGVDGAVAVDDQHEFGLMRRNLHDLSGNPPGRHRGQPLAQAARVDLIDRRGRVVALTAQRTRTAATPM